MSVTTTVRLEDLATVIEAMDHEDVVRRIWERDGTVWTDPVAPEVENRLGWLDAPDVSRPLVATIDDLAAQAIEAGVSDVVLCGMGGSSLAPEVFAATLPTASHHPTLTVLDSTHPEAVSPVDHARTESVRPSSHSAPYRQSTRTSTFASTTPTTSRERCSSSSSLPLSPGA